MKHRKLITTSLIGAGVLALAVGAAQAGPGGGWGHGMGRGDCAMHGGPGPRHHHGGYDMGMRGGMFHGLRALDLSAEQRAEIFKISQAHREAMFKHREQLRETRQALREAALSEPYDAKAVRRLADRQAKIQADMLVERTETMHKIAGVLTPEQREEFKKLQSMRGPRDFGKK